MSKNKISIKKTRVFARVFLILNINLTIYNIVEMKNNVNYVKK